MFNISDKDRKETKNPSVSKLNTLGGQVPGVQPVFTFSISDDDRLDPGSEGLTGYVDTPVAVREAEEENQREVVRQAKAKAKAEMEKLAAAWNELSEEEKNSFMATSSTTAFTISFLDNVLPFPVFMTILKKVDMTAAAKVQNAIRQNPEAASAGTLTGTIIGLVGGPLAFAKIGKGGVTLLAKNQVRISGYRGANRIKAIRKDVQEKIKKTLADAGDNFDPKTTGANITAKLAQKRKDLATIQAFEQRWASMIQRSDWTTDQIRRRLTELLAELPTSHPLIRAAGSKKDLYHTAWDSIPNPKSPPTNWMSDIYKRVMFRTKDLDDNFKVGVAKMAGYFGGDFAATFTYSLGDWIEKGYSQEESQTLALAYALDVTWKDVSGDVITAMFGGKHRKTISALLVRAGLLYPDLSGDDGTVRSETYEDKVSEDAHLNAVEKRAAVAEGKSEGYDSFLYTGGTVKRKGKGIMKNGSISPLR